MGAGVTTYVALIRGINLSGKKRVAMGDLEALFASLGTLWERRLKVPATTRNWRAVTKLVELANR